MDIEKEVKKVQDIMDDPYPFHQDGQENLLEQDIGLADQDMIDLQDAWKATKEAEAMDPWDAVIVKDEQEGIWDSLSNETWKKWMPVWKRLVAVPTM